jgi:hypothetical protein
MQVAVVLVGDPNPEEQLAALRASQYEVTKVVPIGKADAVVVICKEHYGIPHEVSRRVIPRYVYRVPA